ncbi:MAG: hypothetical protein Kow0077_01800 [Anaerolineae bacterium]
MQDFPLLVGLCLIPGIGGVTLRALLNHFGSVRAITNAPDRALLAVRGVGPRILAGIRAIDEDTIRARLEEWQQAGITLLTWSDLRYPEQLYHMHDAPPLLYCRGRALPLPDRPAVAIVGTRHPSGHARQTAEALGEALAQRGWLVVSGLAWGVDMAAHSGALRSGPTVAILGGGVDRVQPRKGALAARIMAHGLLCSEQPPGTPPGPAGLVARNRLISGLSKAVIVVEAGEESGSMYTARFAQEQGRPLLAVDTASTGNQALIQQGAYAIPRINWDADALDALLRQITSTPPD